MRDEKLSYRRQLDWIRSSALGLALVANCAGVASAADRFRVLTIPLAEPAERILLMPTARTLVVAHPDRNKLSVVDTVNDVVVQVIATGGAPYLLEYDAVRSRVLVIEPYRVEYFDLSEGLLTFFAHIDTPFSFPWRSLFDSSRDRLYMVDYYLRGLGVLQNAQLNLMFSGNCAADFSIVHSITSDRDNENIVLTEAGEPIANPAQCQGATQKPPRVTLLDAETLVDQRLSSSINVFKATYSPDKDRIYALISNLALQYIDVASGVSHPITVGPQPAGMVVDESRDVVYVTDRARPYLYRVNGADIDAQTAITVTTTQLPAPARDVWLDTVGGRLFAVDMARSQVSLIDSSTDILGGTYRVGSAPRFSALSAGSRKLYTSNTGEQVNFSLSVLVPLAHPGQTGAVATPANIAADGNSTTVVTVIPRDSAGLPLGTGRIVRIVTTAGTLLDTVVDHGDGRYTQQLRASVNTETAVLTVLVDGEEVTTQPRVAFESISGPSILIMLPEWAVPTGGTPVSMMGAGFLTNFHAPADVHRVFFGDQEATDVVAVSDDEIQCVTPPHAPGVVDVTLSMLLGGVENTAVLRQGFTFVDETNLTLTMTKGSGSDLLELVWSQGTSGRVTIERAATRDFSTDVVAASSSGGSLTDNIPAGSQLLFYRITR